ncbi:hypothetical protein MF271_06420 [Deinococcus sp. KNUC1210]|uniref:hypothetical protein n=1 Tax=Deinococcus sp. KNUC1210 TaxID=2917691 RepID=UPI001EEFBF45|nr:hypothetical protein [Deinococcus sp. KNUC1210]ULH16238.1 hypothetical protein MF271_06420 [Deinococcus sp. KNUC1210]
MNDRFQELFTECVVAHGRFGHAAHVHLTWRLLEEYSALEALARLEQGLRAVAQSAGQPENYSATLTTALFLLILEQRQRGQTWEAFAAQQPGLLDWNACAGQLGALYSADLLQSTQARRVFVLPTPGSRQAVSGGSEV